jgi:hypothetical protein
VMLDLKEVRNALIFALIVQNLSMAWKIGILNVKVAKKVDSYFAFLIERKNFRKGSEFSDFF